MDALLMLADILIQEREKESNQQPTPEHPAVITIHLRHVYTAGSSSTHIHKDAFCTFTKWQVLFHLEFDVSSYVW